MFVQAPPVLLSFYWLHMFQPRTILLLSEIPYKNFQGAHEQQVADHANVIISVCLAQIFSPNPKLSQLMIKVISMHFYETNQ